MKFERTTLSNGLRIVTAQLQEAQSVSVNIFAGVGSRDETFEVNGGVSHFLEHLLFKGSQKRPEARIIAEAIDGVGGSGNAYTSHELTSYYIKLPKQHLELGLDILADMIKHPILDEVDRERGVVIEEMNVDRDDPARYVYDLLPPLLWPSDQLGKEIIGSEEVIKAIPRDDILNYQQTHYSADNLVVAVAGDHPHHEIVKQVTELMGDMKPQERAERPLLKPDLAPERFQSLAKETNQAHLMIGCQAYPYNHPNDAAARVVANLLGAGMSSRLFTNVRERQGLAYSVYTYYSNFMDTGLFSVYAGVNLEKVDQAITSIMNELGRISTEAVAPGELDKVKNKMSGSLQMALENTFAIADRIGTRMLLLDQIKTPEETLEEIAAVTAEDVQRVAAELLDPERLRLAIISPDPTSASKHFEGIIKESYAKT
jgi:predicted Zn-dependent peptidase